MASAETKVVIIALLILAVGFFYTSVQEHGLTGHVARLIPQTKTHEPKEISLPVEEPEAYAEKIENPEPEGTNLERPVSAGDAHRIVAALVSQHIDCPNIPKELRVPAITTKCAELTQKVTV